MNKLINVLFGILVFLGCASSPSRSTTPHYRDEELTGSALTHAAAQQFHPTCNASLSPSRTHRVEVTFRGNGAALYLVMIATEERGNVFGTDRCYIEVADGEEVNVRLGVNETPLAMSIVPLHDNDHTGTFNHSLDQLVNPTRVLRDGFEQTVTRACWQENRIESNVCEFRFSSAVSD